MRSPVTVLPQVPGRSAVKIALLTPYTGGNLGDAAIQESAIAAITHRFPGASIVLVTLSPKATTELHRLSSFPLRTTTYGPGFRTPRDESAPPPLQRDFIGKLRGKLRRSATALRSIQYLRRLVHRVLRGIGVAEVVHGLRAVRQLRNATMVIVSGGGQIDDFWGGPFRHPYTLFKWALIAKIVGAKYLFLSVGVCQLQSKLSTFFVHRALKLADYRSYRDDRSKHLLHHLPFTRCDPVYPDLAFGYSPAGTTATTTSTRHPLVVGISPIAYLSHHGWPLHDAQTHGTYKDSLCMLIRYLIERDFRVVLFTSAPIDRHVVDEILASISTSLAPARQTHVRHPQTQTLDAFFKELNQVDFVIASRLHGILLSHLICKPVLALSYDHKVDSHMSQSHLTEHCLDIHDVTVDRLISAFESLESHRLDIVSTLRNATARYRTAVTAQYDHIFRSNDSLLHTARS